MRSAECQPEASHDLVENQQGAVIRSERTDCFEVSACRGDTAHVANHRLDNHAGNLVLEFLEGFLKGIGIVVGQGNSEPRKFLGDAG